MCVYFWKLNMDKYVHIIKASVKENGFTNFWIISINRYLSKLPIVNVHLSCPVSCWYRKREDPQHSRATSCCMCTCVLSRVHNRTEPSVVRVIRRDKCVKTQPFISYKHWCGLHGGVSVGVLNTMSNYNTEKQSQDPYTGNGNTM